MDSGQMTSLLEGCLTFLMAGFDVFPLRPRAKLRSLTSIALSLKPLAAGVQVRQAGLMVFIIPIQKRPAETM